MGFLTLRSWICVSWETGADSHEEAMDRCLNSWQTTTRPIATDDAPRLIEAEESGIKVG